MQHVDIPVSWNDLEVERIVDEAISAKKTRVKKSSMKIGEYNGFSREKRLDADRKIKVALELGLIPPAEVCCLCGNTSGRIDYHAEDYSRPLKVASLCQKCHLALHNRHRTPGYASSWKHRLTQYSDGTNWFDQII